MRNVPRVLTTQVALEFGYGRHAIANKVARGHWRRLVRGVYLTNSGEPTPRDWLLAALLWAGPEAMLAGLPALQLCGLRIECPDAPIVLLVPPGCGRRSTGRIVVRRSECLPEARLVAGLRVASVARSVVEACLLTANLGSVRDIATSAVQQRLCTVDQIDGVLAMVRRNSSGMLRKVVAEIAGGAESVAECEVGDLLRAAGITGFRQNAVIHDATGRAIARGDVVWEEERAILEIDSAQWHSAPEQWRRTMQRHNRLELMGYSVLHYPPADIRRDPREFVNTVRTWLAGRRRHAS